MRFASAQGKPLRLIVPYPPGGPLDILARALAERVKDTLGVVIVDNCASAGGGLNVSEEGAALSSMTDSWQAVHVVRGPV